MVFLSPSSTVDVSKSADTYSDLHTKSITVDFLNGLTAGDLNSAINNQIIDNSYI